MLLESKPHQHGGRGLILSPSSPSGNPECLTELARDLTGFVTQAVQNGTSFADFETGVFQRVLAMGGIAADLFLKAQGDGDLGQTVCTAQGIELHRSDKVQMRKLRTIFKEHSFESFVYSRGAKQKIELRPIDARLNLPEHKASYLLQEFTQLFCIEDAFGVGAGQFERIFKQKISVDVLEKINREMGASADRFLEEQLQKPKAEDEGQLLILTADGKGVPLVQSDAKKVPAFDAKERPGNRRMATLGCVYTVDRFPRTPEQIVAALFRDATEDRPKEKRPEACFKHYRSYFAYAASGQEPIPGGVRTWTWLAQEAGKRYRVGQPIIRLMDGQASLWEAADMCLSEFLQEQNAGQKDQKDTNAKEQKKADDVLAIDILDILHVSSYVWRAAKVFHGHKEQQEAFAQERLLAILRGEIASVVKGLRWMATRYNLQDARLGEIATVCTYFENNAKRMRYDEYLREGYPIATGVIEGACRHVIKDRMEQGGMRWTLKGAESMLDLRAVNASCEVERFHVWRQEEEAKRVHPHRELVVGYDGFKA